MPPTLDDVSITTDGHRLDTKAKVFQSLAEIKRLINTNYGITKASFDLKLLVSVLDKLSVDYVVVGGIGAMAYGANSKPRIWTA